MTVELYHFWSSVCSVRCRMALEEKGVAWESRYIDLFRFDQMTPDYLALNPAGVVPTLVHDGRPIRESTVINEYIDDAFDGPALVPADPFLAARMREFVRLCEDEFSAIVFPTFVKYILPKLRNRWGDEELRKQAERRPMAFYRDVHGRGIRAEIAPEEIEDCHRRVLGILDRMEAMLDDHGGPWLVGAFSLADIAVAPYMFRLLALGQDTWWAPDVRPLVSAWYAAVSQRDAYLTAVNWPDETGGGYEEVGLTTQR